MRYRPQRRATSRSRRRRSDASTAAQVGAACRATSPLRNNLARSDSRRLGIQLSHAKSATPRQPRDRDRSAQFVIDREHGLIGHDGSVQFTDDRGGRTSKLVMRVRFPSPALEIVPGFIEFSVRCAAVVGGPTPRQPRESSGGHAEMCLTPRQPREKPRANSEFVKGGPRRRCRARARVAEATAVDSERDGLVRGHEPKTSAGKAGAAPTTARAQRRRLQMSDVCAGRPRSTNINLCDHWLPSEPIHDCSCAQ